MDHSSKDRDNMEQRTAMEILESLTPGGSEFYNDPERCGRYIRNLINFGHQAKKDQVRLKHEKMVSSEILKELQEIIVIAKAKL
ncbi:hypothetical protein LCGC14_1311400 [marine sediment metagenome]|uniref:Uncharacterized protein n=1 Tax=marine sediment metagenome TaxID=412755 RepID=A0A0F9KMN7_9ZZZZ